jgi:hypothetical protein
MRGVRTILNGRCVEESGFILRYFAGRNVGKM